MTRYTDKDKEAAIGFMTNNFNHQTGYPNWTMAHKKTKISKPTLQRWWNERNSDSTSHIRDLKKEEFIDKAWAEILAGLQAMANKRDSANYKEVATSVGILIDKVQLLKGEPTVIAKTENKNTERFEHLSDEELEKEIETLKNV